MKKRIIATVGIFILLVSTLLSACSTVKDKKTLVAYFSATGNTKAVAEQLAEETGADMFEIVPKEPYTKVQLGYDDPEQRITTEQADETCRVEIDGVVENFEQYDTVYIGYPIWYGKAPRIILTFLESYHFEGKKIIPFCTSDNDGIEAGLDEIKKAAPDAEWLDGQRFDGGKVAEALDESGTIIEEAVKEEIARFAERTSPNAETNKKKGKENGDTTKAFEGEKAPFEEGSNTTDNSSTTQPDQNNSATTEKEEGSSSATQKQDDNSTTQQPPAENTTEPITESTTLDEYETPYIPIP